MKKTKIIKIKNKVFIILAFLLVFLSMPISGSANPFNTGSSFSNIITKTYNQKSKIVGVNDDNTVKLQETDDDNVYVINSSIDNSNPKGNNQVKLLEDIAIPRDTQRLFYKIEIKEVKKTHTPTAVLVRNRASIHDGYIINHLKIKTEMTSYFTKKKREIILSIDNSKDNEILGYFNFTIGRQINKNWQRVRASIKKVKRVNGNFDIILHYSQIKDFSHTNIEENILKYDITKLSVQKFNDYLGKKFPNAKQAIDNLNNQISILTRRRVILASTLKNYKLPSQFGFVEPKTSSSVGISYSFKKANDIDGNVTITANLSKRQRNLLLLAKVDFTLWGYQTLLEKHKMETNLIISRVERLFNRLKTATRGTNTIIAQATNTFPSDLEFATTASKLGFVDPSIGKREGANVAFRIKSTNNEAGTLVVEVTISKTPGSSKKVEFTLKGFKTISIRDQREQENANLIISKVENLFDDLKNATNGTNTNLANAATTLPSDLKFAKTPSEIGFLDPSIGKKEGANVAFRIKSTNNEAGTLVVEATISKTPGSSKKVEFTLKGFQTSDQKEKIEADLIILRNEKLFDDLKNAIDGTNTNLANAATTLPSDLGQTTFASEIGFIDPSFKKREGASVLFKIKSTNDNNGTLVVETTISKAPGMTKKIEFTLKGFQTLAQKEKMKADLSISKIEKLFIALKNIYQDFTTTLTNRENIFPSDLKLATTANELGFIDPSHGKRNGVNVNFKVKSTNDNDGTLIFEATISKVPGTTKKVELTLKGFKNSKMKQKKYNSLSNGSIAAISFGGGTALFVSLYVISKIIRKRRLF